jgi:gas vesicle protein
MEMKSFSKGLFVGGFAGALAALLLAPKSGKELRGNVQEKADRTLKDAKQAYSDSRTKARAIIEDAEVRAGELRREVDRRFSQVRSKARKILRRKEESAEAERPTEEPSPIYH